MLRRNTNQAVFDSFLIALARLRATSAHGIILLRSI
jgi:hypothetical protein